MFGLHKNLNEMLPKFFFEFNCGCFKLTVVELVFFTSYFKPKLQLHDFLFVTLYKKLKIEMPT